MSINTDLITEQRTLSIECSDTGDTATEALLKLVVKSENVISLPSQCFGKRELAAALPSHTVTEVLWGSVDRL